jgi:hypothetical protein
VRKGLVRLAGMSILFTGLACADTISIVFPNLMSNAPATLKIQSNGNGGVDTGQSGITSGNPLALSAQYTLGDLISNYTNNMLTVTGAFLQLPFVLDNPLVSGASSWVIFSGVTGAGTVSIQSALHSVSNIPVANLANYDLFANGFQADFLAGHPITITFNISDTLTPLWDNQPGNLSGVSFYSISDIRPLHGTPTSPLQLVLNVADTPEPYTPALFGLGLAAIGFLKWRKSR